MSIIKRIIISIVRRPFKSLLLLLSILLLGTFTGGSYIIYKAFDILSTSIKENLDSFAIIRQTEEYNYAILSDDEYYELQCHIFDIFNTLKKDDEIKASYFQLSSQMNGFVSDLSYPDYHFFYDVDEGGLKLNGIEADSMLEQKNIIDLAEGRFITQQDNDNNAQVIVLDQNTTYRDGSIIQIGDKIRVTYQNYEWNNETNEAVILNRIDYEFEVIGKYIVREENSAVWEDILYDSYIPYSTLSQMRDEIRKADISKTGYFDETIFSYRNLIFELKNPENLKIFKDKFRELNKNNPYYHMLTSADNYFAVKGTLENLRSISLIIICTSIVASILITTLIVYLYLKDHTKEIGILIAIGEYKKNILAQMVGEILIIGLLGLSLSVFSSGIIGSKLSQNIITEQLQVDEIISINIDIEYCIIIMGIGCILLCLSALLPLAKQFKQKPKDLLM